MAIVVCSIDDCEYRSKRPLRKYTYKDGRKCYGCKMNCISVGKIIDMDGDAEALLGKENMAQCRNYKPK